MISNTLASVAVPALAMFLPNWRALILIAICPIPLILLASFFGFVPESLSWLICEGKTELVRQTIEKVAQVNGKSLQVNINATFYDIHYVLTLSVVFNSIILHCLLTGKRKSTC